MPLSFRTCEYNIFSFYSAFLKWFNYKYLSVQDNIFILSHILVIPLIKNLMSTYIHTSLKMERFYFMSLLFGLLVWNIGIAFSGKIILLQFMVIFWKLWSIINTDRGHSNCKVIQHSVKFEIKLFLLHSIDTIKGINLMNRRFWVSEWLLFSTKIYSAISRPEQVNFQWLDMSFYSDTISRLWADQSVFFLLNASCLAER